jgi:type I restriction enzyme, S subunit
MTSKYKSYPKYKDSGVEWLSVIPDHWEAIKIKHLSQIKRGASPRPIDDQRYFDNDGKYAWVRIADVTASGRYLTTTTQRLSNLGSSLSVKLEPGEIFLSIAGTVGKPCIAGMKICIHDGFVYFPSLNIPVSFLYYVFAGGEAYKGLGKFGTQLNLNTDTVGDIKIGCPSIDDIEQITAFLDRETGKLDELIAKQQDLIALLEEKRQAVISHAVTKGLNPNAPMKPSGIEWLGDIPEHWVVTKSKFVSTVFIPQRNKPDLNDSQGVAWATMEDMHKSNISLTKHYVEHNAMVKSGSKILKSGSVIASCVGNFGVASINDCDVIINQQLQAFVPHSINAEYLREIITLSKTYFEKIGTAATLIYVNKQGFEELPVLIPSSDEQHQIIEYLDKQTTKFDKLTSKAKEAIELMRERRTALISAAVTGKIDVRDYEI